MVIRYITLKVLLLSREYYRKEGSQKELPGKKGASLLHAQQPKDALVIMT